MVLLKTSIVVYNRSMKVTPENISNQSWFSQLETGQQDLFLLGGQLLERERSSVLKFSDYSFVIFPFAKAYEGFLKQFLFQQGLITESVYMGNKFRIGRSLNPDIRESQRDEWWLYDDVVLYCGDKLARDLWDTWIESRNHVFHYFPKTLHTYSLDKIESKIGKMLNVVEQAWMCKIQKEREV